MLFISLDGPDQSFCQSLCRHSRWQLPNNWTETSRQFWKEVLLKYILKINKHIWLTQVDSLVICSLLSIFDFTSECYLTMVKWVTQEKLSVRWVNRAQNMSILSLCDVTTGDCTKVRNVLLSPKISNKCTVLDVFWADLISPIQKHVMTSEKWLDRQVSASLHRGFIIFDGPVYCPIKKKLAIK